MFNIGNTEIQTWKEYIKYQGMRLVKIWWEFGVTNLYFWLFRSAGVLFNSADHDPCKLSCKSATVSQSTTRYDGYVVFYQSVHALASQETSPSPSQLTRDSPAILLAISVLANLSVTFLFSQSISHYSPDSHSTRHLYSEKHHVNHRSERSSSKRVGTRHSGLARSNLCALSSLEWRGGLRSFWTWLSVSNEVSAYGRTGEKMVS